MKNTPSLCSDPRNLRLSTLAPIILLALLAGCGSEGSIDKRCRQVEISREEECVWAYTNDGRLEQHTRVDGAFSLKRSLRVIPKADAVKKLGVSNFFLGIDKVDDIEAGWHDVVSRLWLGEEREGKLVELGSISVQASVLDAVYCPSDRRIYAHVETHNPIDLDGYYKGQSELWVYSVSMSSRSSPEERLIFNGRLLLGNRDWQLGEPMGMSHGYGTVKWCDAANTLVICSVHGSVSLWKFTDPVRKLLGIPFYSEHFEKAEMGNGIPDCDVSPDSRFVAVAVCSSDLGWGLDDESRLQITIWDIESGAIVCTTRETIRTSIKHAPKVAISYIDESNLIALTPMGILLYKVNVLDNAMELVARNNTSTEFPIDVKEIATGVLAVSFEDLKNEQKRFLSVEKSSLTERMMGAEDTGTEH